MRVGCRHVLSALVFAAAAFPLTAQDAEPPIVVTAVRPETITVTAPPHCYKRPGDPADAVPVSTGRTRQRVIAPDKSGALSWHPDNEPVLGPAVWQRAGDDIGDYKFRAPADGSPLCIGAYARSPIGYAQLRQIVDASAWRGKYVHFSALVATRSADEVRFWLAAGDRGNLQAIGGDTHKDPLQGTHGWRQVDLLVGPVPKFANHVSYGFLLYGRGDVWITNPKLEVLDRAAAERVTFTPVAPLAPPEQRATPLG